MKINIITLVLLASFISCNRTSNQKAELEKLKIQREEINSKISQLEAVVNPTGKDTVVKAVTVNVENISPSIFNHYVEVQGIIDADQNVSVSPQSAGIVKAVYVKEGSAVKKGTLLAILDAEVLKQSIVEVQTQYEMANTIFIKQKALWDKNIGSEVQYLQAKSSKESLERRIKTLEEQLEMSKIVSPINGTVEDVPLKVGQMASPGMPNSAIRVINMNTAKVIAQVSENFATRIKNGNQVLVNFPDLGKEIETNLSFTSRFIDPSNRTFKVECRFSTGDIELRANMIVYVKIKDYTNEKAVCIPVNLVQSNQEGKFIYIAKQAGNNWIASRSIIKTGIDYNGSVEVLEGLNEKDQVITSGYQNIKEGGYINF